MSGLPREHSTNTLNPIQLQPCKSSENSEPQVLGPLYICMFFGVSFSEWCRKVWFNWLQSDVLVFGGHGYVSLPLADTIKVPEPFASDPGSLLFLCFDLLMALGWCAQHSASEKTSVP